MGKLNNLSKTTEIFRGSPGTRTPALLLPMIQVEETFRSKLRGHLSTALGLTVLVTYFFTFYNTQVTDNFSKEKHFLRLYLKF